MAEEKIISDKNTDWSIQTETIRPYEDEKNNAAFNRWVDVMARLIQKHGGSVLQQIRQSVLSQLSCIMFSEKKPEPRECLARYSTYREWADLLRSKESGSKKSQKN